MREANKVAIATLVMRNKEYLVAIRPEGDILALETMFFADEVRSPEREFPALPDDAELNEREISMAQLLIESMESEWDPERFGDTHRAKIEEIIQSKRAGETIVTATGEAPTAKVVDLMEALNASIAASQSGGRAAKTKSKTKSEQHKAPAAKRATRTPAAGGGGGAAAAKKASGAGRDKAAPAKAAAGRKAS
jgi:DNA end-binding protein Ku